MAISSVSSDLNQSLVASDISISLIKKSIDSTKQNGQAIVKLMDDSNPNLGKYINTRA